MPYDEDQIANLEAELDDLTDPSTVEVLAHSQDYDAGIVAAVGISRGGSGGGGGSLPEGWTQEGDPAAVEGHGGSLSFNEQIAMSRDIGVVSSPESSALACFLADGANGQTKAFDGGALPVTNLAEGADPGDAATISQIPTTLLPVGWTQSGTPSADVDTAGGKIVARSRAGQDALEVYDEEGNLLFSAGDDTSGVAFGQTGNITDVFAPIAMASQQIQGLTYIQFNGMTGATAGVRIIGGTASGAPATGTFAVGDLCIAEDGHLFICLTGGTPGTWTDVVELYVQSQGFLQAGQAAFVEPSTATAEDIATALINSGLMAGS